MLSLQPAVERSRPIRSVYWNVLDTDPGLTDETGSAGSARRALPSATRARPGAALAFVKDAVFVTSRRRLASLTTAGPQHHYAVDGAVFAPIASVPTAWYIQ